MAIRKNYTHNTVEYANAYIRIERVTHGFKDFEKQNAINMHCWAMVYPDKPEADERPVCETNIIFDYDISSSDNLMKQAYEAMKTLPEWQDATDDI
jgi:hypothetical protein